MSDQQIACCDCGGVFVFTEAEQAFYAEKQLAAPPKRCKACRQAKKAAQSAGSGRGGGRDRQSGSGFSRGPSDRSPRPSGGWRGSSPPPGRNGNRPNAAFGRTERRPPSRQPSVFPPPPPQNAEKKPEKQARARPERPKFDILCAECGTTAQVPFKPLEGRQVFCQPCYRARRGSVENTTAGLDVAETDPGIIE